jgi:hypothetical protein
MIGGKECVACKNKAWKVKTVVPYPLCVEHLNDVSGLDDLAREIYVKEWLIPQKKKLK